MAIRKPIVSLENNIHAPLPTGDAVGANSIAISTEANNILKAGSDNGLFVAQTATRPYMRWEIGHTAQPNNGKGIDEGSYYRLDMSLAYSGSIPGSIITYDKYLQLPGGIYLVLVDCTLSVSSSATGLHRTSFMTSTEYGFPGVYQLAVRNFITLNGATIYTFPMVGSINSWGAPYNNTGTFAYEKGPDGSASMNGHLMVMKMD
ncbi:hypothetical protein [Photorhabdus caribbeanensis]|uniref:hypothetical protein n=1 Tax=Photorhabdus caribbeanensis TaxID=1004165 RepID=UPI001BD4915B|nr:hypothetical protein [Photorhabdus caribbeanensis]MBS9424545.1 hypothetical protein [Photorhabdus caribbeanensis]